MSDTFHERVYLRVKDSKDELTFCKLERFGSAGLVPLD